MDEEQLNRINDLSLKYWDVDSFEAVEIAIEVTDAVPGIIREIKRLKEENSRLKTSLQLLQEEENKE